MASPNWIKHPTELIGQRVKLVPLDIAHFEELCLLAKEKSIWELTPFDTDNGNIENLIIGWKQSLERRSAGEFYPFSIMLVNSDKIIGTTRYWQISEQNRNLEIGGTWMHPDYWNSGLNTECKYLLLKHCFETLKTVRVQLKASEKNIRSRKAIEKIGAKLEGILRNDKIYSDGTKRTAAYYSIIDDEWPAVKLRLEGLLKG